MQTWAKRGLQTALVTGGLLMLGTGIASADEDVNPDKPASELDGSVSVPVHIDNNAVGNHVVPAVHKDVTLRTSDVTGKLPSNKATAAADPVVNTAKRTTLGAAAPAVDRARGTLSSSTEDARDQATPLAAKTRPVTDRLSAVPGADRFSQVTALDKVELPTIARDGETARGNQVNLDLVIPIEITGNAVAVLSNASATNNSAHSYGHDHDVHGSSGGGTISGNIVDVDWAAPVQVTNNAIAVMGKACTDGTSSQDAWATGDIVADGSQSVLGGNVVAPQLATPVQADGNAIAGLGYADAKSESDSSATSGGYILTSGEDSVGGGNAVPVPVGMPVKVNNNALMGLGKARSEGNSTADAHAGATRPGMYGVPTYTETSGASALLGGNIVDTSGSGPVLLCGNAGGVGGVAGATCDTKSKANAGGTNRTTGANGIGSGAIGAPSVALPVDGYGNPVVVLGRATTDANNTVNSSAGGDSYTRGHEGVLSGTTATGSAAGPLELFANPIAGAGQASSTVHNTMTNDAGGHSGTTGDDSVGGGNMGTVPVVMPGEIFGNTAAGLGSTEATVTEDKTSESGGGSNTDDDNGVLASNVVNAPAASAAQVFGNGAGAAGVTKTTASTDEEVTAGGPSKATGTAGLGSGNIGQTPISQPFQVFGSGGSVLGKGRQTAINKLDSESGGDATSDGTHGLAAGNVVSTPAGGAGQAWGESVAVLGMNHALAGSKTESDAGGDTDTSGQGGTGSGNVVSPQALPLVQSFAVAASGLGGNNSSTATNQTDAESGGDIDTNGDRGVLSGNLVDTPAGAQAQPFGDAVSAIGSSSYAQGLSETEGEVGGTSDTSGAGGSLSGIDATTPVAARAPLYNVPIEILAQAITESANWDSLKVGESSEPQFDLAANNGGIAPTEVPSFSRQARTMPADPVQGVFSGILPGFAGAVPQGPARAEVNNPAPNPAGDLLGGHLFGGLLGGGAPELPQTPGARMDAPQEYAPAAGDLGDMVDVTTLVPVIPAAPVSADLPALQQAPSPRAAHESSLDSTRAALANLFTAHPVA
ncbi:hypothetical protein [Actinophytocola sp.]|uniref:hypothetical protein n=1 Tax=Actinophytocola sp. TaxID=1872138 RepID=UPI002ED4AAA9